MAKQSGIGANLYLAQYDLTGDVGSVQTIRGGRTPIDVTGIDKAAPERVLGLRDGEIGFAGWWNASAGQIVDVLNDMPTTDLLSTVTIPTTVGAYAVGDLGASMVGKQIMFDQTRGQDGSLAVSSQIMANGYPVEYGALLTTGKQTFTGSANGTSLDRHGIDFTTSTAFGAASYLHVFSFTGTSATFTVADSADNTTFAAITGLAHTAATAATSERLQTSTTATIRRYVRVQVTGTFTSCVAALVFVRYLESQAT